MRGHSIFLNAFLDNLSGAALFGKLRRPGAPMEMIDSRSVEEYLASGEYEETVLRYRSAVEEWQRDRARAKQAQPALDGEPAYR